MEGITTDWLTPELAAQYRMAVRHVNLTDLCRKHGTTRGKVHAVLNGKTAKASTIATAIVVLDEALAEYNAACLIISNAGKIQSHV